MSRLFCLLLVAACASTPVRPNALVAPEPLAEILRGGGVDPLRLRCNQSRSWGSDLKQDSEDGAHQMMALLEPHVPEGERAGLEKKLAKLLFWRLVRAVLLEGNNNNLGVLRLEGHFYKDTAGQTRPVLIFRSGFTPDPEKPDSCFASLLDGGGVRHVINLFDGDIPVDDLVAAEKRAATARGATYRIATDEPGAYGPWRDLLRKHYDDPAARSAASLSVARLVRDEILAPGGAPPRGNIHLHCGGGMHRSGMIAGVVEKCVNHAPEAIVEAHYRFHTAFIDPAHPGGAEDLNLQFIRDFDCSLLDKP